MPKQKKKLAKRWKKCYKIYKEFDDYRNLWYRLIVT